MSPGFPEEQTFPVPLGASTIGRTKDNDIFCLHKSLSRKHARLDFDGSHLRITDLQSKNGVFFEGRRVKECQVVEGDSFRCGDVTFLVEGATTRRANVSAPAQTLQSPLQGGGGAAKRPAPAVVVEDDERAQERLFSLLRASELLVGSLPLERLLDELVVLLVQVVQVDRVALLTLDEDTLELRPGVLKTFVGSGARPYSKRVVDWVIDHGSTMSFADVGRDKSLPGDAASDAAIRGAVCVPLNPGGGTIGVLYADSVTRVDAFRADDVVLVRAIANFAALAIEGHALRRVERKA